jgi:hypothetical protein
MDNLKFILRFNLEFGSNQNLFGFLALLYQKKQWFKRLPVYLSGLIIYSNVENPKNSVV